MHGCILMNSSDTLRKYKATRDTQEHLHGLLGLPDTLCIHRWRHLGQLSEGIRGLRIAPNVDEDKSNQSQIVFKTFKKKMVLWRFSFPLQGLAHILDSSCGLAFRRHHPSVVSHGTQQTPRPAGSRNAMTSMNWGWSVNSPMKIVVSTWFFDNGNRFPHILSTMCWQSRFW